MNGSVVIGALVAVRGVAGIVLEVAGVLVFTSAIPTPTSASTSNSACPPLTETVPPVVPMSAVEVVSDSPPAVVVDADAVCSVVCVALATDGAV